MKIPIIDEKDLNLLIEQALKNEGVLTAPTEISQMIINVKGVSINATPRKDGRFQGYLIDENNKKYVYGKTREEVAIKIKEYLKNGFPKKKKADTLNGVPTTFNAFAIYYFENFRKRKVTSKTYRCDLSRFRNYLQSRFAETLLKNITAKDCQDLLNEISLSGKGKTADEIYSLLSVIFKTAIKHGILKTNPLEIIYHEKHEKKHGKSLTIEEERRFKGEISAITDEKVLLGLVLMLCTGLRPNELKTAKIEDGFIVAVNSKRKTKNVELKKIPIIKALIPYLPKELPYFSERTVDKMRKELKRIFPSHILYDLRTTFYSRCKEFNVSEHAIKSYMGHSLGEIANAYTDLSDEFLILEGKKLDKWEF